MTCRPNRTICCIQKCQAFCSVLDASFHRPIIPTIEQLANKINLQQFCKHTFQLEIAKFAYYIEFSAHRLPAKMMLA